MSWFLTKEESRFIEIMNSMPFESWVKTGQWWLNKELHLMIGYDGIVHFYKRDGDEVEMTTKIRYGRKVKKLFKKLNQRQLELEIENRCKIGEK